MARPCGLVEDQKPRREGEPHGDLEQPLVAVGERARELPRLARKPHAGECGPGRGRQIPRAGALHGQGHIVEGREPRKDRGDLEGIGDAAAHPDMGGQAGDVAPVEADRARLRRDAPRQKPHERGLARAVRPDQRMDLARDEVEIHPVDRAEAAEVAHEAAGFQKAHGRLLTPRSRRRPRSPRGAKSTRRISTAPTTNCEAVVTEEAQSIR